MKTNRRWTRGLAVAAVLAAGLFVTGSTVRADDDDWEDRHERHRERIEDAIDRERDRAEDWYDRAEDALRHQHRHHRRNNWFGDWHDDYFHYQRERLHRERDRYDDRLEDRYDWHPAHKHRRRAPVATWGGYQHGGPWVEYRAPLPAAHPRGCHCPRCESRSLSFWLRTY